MSLQIAYGKVRNTINKPTNDWSAERMFATSNALLKIDVPERLVKGSNFTHINHWSQSLLYIIYIVLMVYAIHCKCSSLHYLMMMCVSAIFRKVYMTTLVFTGKTV